MIGHVQLGGGLATEELLAFGLGVYIGEPEVPDPEYGGYSFTITQDAYLVKICPGGFILRGDT